jgi:hypothetical protein
LQPKAPSETAAARQTESARRASNDDMAGSLGVPRCRGSAGSK